MIDPDYRGRLGIAIDDPYQAGTPVLTGFVDGFLGRAIVLRLDPPRRINGKMVERVIAWPSAISHWWYEGESDGIS